MSCRHDLAIGTCVRCYPGNPFHRDAGDRIEPSDEESYAPNLDGPGAVTCDTSGSIAGPGAPGGSEAEDGPPFSSDAIIDGSIDLGWCVTATPRGQVISIQGWNRSPKSMGGGWYLECDLRSVDLDAAALGRLLLILSANLDLAGDPASVRLARVLRVVDHGDDLEREPEIDRLRLDLIIEDARVIEGDRKSRAMKLSPNLAVTGISELAACVVQLADQSRHLRRLLMMIGRAARPDPEAT